MAQFMFAYHGGSKPSTPEEGAKVMAAWQNWFSNVGDAFVNPGNPVSMSKTVSSSGVADDGGSNPLSGYGIVEAESMDAAVEIAKGCPILDDDGTVEVAEIHQM